MLRARSRHLPRRTRVAVLVAGLVAAGLAPLTASAPPAAADLPLPTYLGSYGSEDPEDVGFLAYPIALAYADSGRLLVGDTATDRVVVMDPVDGGGLVAVSWFGGRGEGDGSSPGELKSPNGLAVAPDGRVAVADGLRGDVQLFTPGAGGAYLHDRTITAPTLSVPYDLDFLPDGRMVVVDLETQVVSVFSPSGDGFALSASFGGPGDQPGRFGQPIGVVGLADGRLAVSDIPDTQKRADEEQPEPSRVQVFEPDGGNFVPQSELYAGLGGDLATPLGLTQDSRGRLVVGDHELHQVHLFEPVRDGWTPVQSFGSDGAGTHQFAGLRDVAVGPDDVLAAADADGFKVKTYGFPGRCAGRTVTVTLAWGQAPTVGSDVVLGTPGADVVDALDGDDVVCGEGGDDVLRGGPGEDLLIGGPGADRVAGGPDADVLIGAAGRDRLYGEAGPDRLRGGGDADRVSGGPGNDVITGDAGRDRLLGDSGRDRVVAGRDADRVNGGSGADKVSGGTGADRVQGDAGRDVVRGDAGRDVVRGNAGSDKVYGGSGPDRLNGGSGKDRCSGGSGRDRAKACETRRSVP